ncbi:MAG: pantoate--beta-alanine ligase [Verrucomicrobiota bacterium]|nr:pantoate--beta-alanine ligase [Verrucomicrobiota bacterium]
MRVIRSVKPMQRLALSARESKRLIGFVPTMGFLHEGHVSLMHVARRKIGPKGLLVVSIFVNPTQFAPHEDLSSYPKDFDRDRKLCRAAGVDLIFAPEPEEIYPPNYSTFIEENSFSCGMEGGSRPTHFRGVTTIVGKLFNIVQPHLAVFGAKDFQQAAIIEKMVKDLSFPVQIIVSDTVREPDGLAMSSRNKYLSPDERIQATVLHEALQYASKMVKDGPVKRAELLEKIKQLIALRPAAQLDYVEFFNPETLRVVQKVARGTQMAIAVRLGKTRLIDNARL